MPAEAPIPEIAALIAEAGGADLHECMQCGSCTAVCPWPVVKQLSPRLILRLASLGLPGYEEEDVWSCVSCGSCLQACPRGLEVTEVMRAVRALLLESGVAPRRLSAPLGSLRAQGNPWSGEPAEREAWARALGIPAFDASCEMLLFACCTQVYDPHGRRAAAALVALLRTAAVAVGGLGDRAVCCGEQARSMGAEPLFQTLRETNERGMRESGATRILVSSPHCLRTLRHEGTPGAVVPPVHHTQLLAALLASGRLRPTKPVDGPVTYHDPCYLGRHEGEYEAPRRVLASIPGIDLREMARNREMSLCCGGGGGGLWAEVPAADRFAAHRVAEARATGARILATACPYCAVMFDDAIKVLELEREIAVMDVAELLAQSVELDP